MLGMSLAACSISIKVITGCFSKSQYDTMLKHWGLRKYLSAKEWREVIYALDSQRAQDSTYDLYDGDKIISELKLQRKRRLYCTTIASKHDPLDAGI